ncbi:MAG: hypothetical protein ACXAEN_21945 [Candidatus Thorarchaeota archaeon]
MCRDRNTGEISDVYPTIQHYVYKDTDQDGTSVYKIFYRSHGVTHYYASVPIPINTRFHVERKVQEVKVQEVKERESTDDESTDDEQPGRPRRRVTPRSVFQALMVGFALMACPTLQLYIDLQKSFAPRKVKKTVRVRVVTKRKGKKRGKNGKKRSRQEVSYVDREVEVDEFPTYPDNYVLLKAHVQAGKTRFMIRAACVNMTEGRSTIIVLRRNKVDMVQIKNRIAQYNAELQEYLRDQGCRNPPYKVEYLDSHFNMNALQNAMGGYKPRIFVTLGNDTQLARINRGLAVMQRHNLPADYCLFVDECDLMDSPGTKTADALHPLKVGAKMVMGVSATVFDSAMNENITAARLIVLDRPEGYLGITSFWQPDPEDALQEAWACSKASDDPFEKDPNLEWFLDHLTQQRPIYIPTFGKRVPIMCLMNIGLITAPQRRLFERGVTDYGDKAVFCLFNGEGLVARHAALGTAPITIKTIIGDITSKYNRAKKTHTWRGLGVSDFYQHLKDNGGVEKFPRIVTIAGNLACRGLAFTSADYGDYLRATKKGERHMVGWRTNYLYYLCAPKTSQAEMIQNAGRPSVVAPIGDYVRVRWFSPPKILDAVLKAAILQDDMIISARRESQEALRQEMAGNACALLKNIMPTIPVYKAKIPAGHKACKKAKLTIRKTNDLSLDKGLPISMYKFDNEEMGSIERAIGAAANVEDDLEREEFVRLTTKQFPLWAMGGAGAYRRIALFMQNLDPTKLYSREELREAAAEHGILRVSELSKYSRGSGSSKGYGKIIIADGDGFRLRRSLVQEFNRYF